MGVGGDGVVKKAKPKKAKPGGESSSKSQNQPKKNKTKNKNKTHASQKGSKKKIESATTISTKPSVSSTEATGSVGDKTDRSLTKIPSREVSAVVPTAPAPAAIVKCPYAVDNAYNIPCSEPKCREAYMNRQNRDDIDREMIDRQTQARFCLDKLTSERDYYKAEYEKLQKFVKKNTEDHQGYACPACQRKDQIIEYLRNENDVLSKEKQFLMCRLEQQQGPRYDAPSPTARCTKPGCKRIERERDLLKLDIHRLEEEIDCLRDKIKTVSEHKTREYARFQEQRTEYENTISKLEGERRELLKCQGLRRATINMLEEKLGTYNSGLRVAQDELQRIKIQYNNLKKLHDQCDKALLDTQAQLAQAEAELAICLKRKDGSRLKSFSGDMVPKPQKIIDQTTHTEEFANEDNLALKRLEQDKDDISLALDQKTEMLNKLQEREREKDEKIKDMQAQMESLQKATRMCAEENNLLGEKLRIADLKIDALKKENAEAQNQEANFNAAVNKIEQQKRSLEAEIDQLNKEAATLIASNQQLQNTLKQCQVQMGITMERIGELEDKVKKMDGIILDYERQIRILKTDLEDCQSQVGRKETEIEQLLGKVSHYKNLSEHLDAENQNREKLIESYKFEIQKMRNELAVLETKEKLIVSLNTELRDLKATKEAIEEERNSMKQKLCKIETKLFDCICCLCDNCHDRCAMVDCLMKEHKDGTSVRSKSIGKDDDMRTTNENTQIGVKENLPRADNVSRDDPQPKQENTFTKTGSFSKDEPQPTNETLLTKTSYAPVESQPPTRKRVQSRSEAQSRYDDQSKHDSQFSKDSRRSRNDDQLKNDSQFSKDSRKTRDDPPSKHSTQLNIDSILRSDSYSKNDDQSYYSKEWDIASALVKPLTLTASPFQDEHSSHIITSTVSLPESPGCPGCSSSKEQKNTTVSAVYKITDVNIPYTYKYSEGLNQSRKLPLNVIMEERKESSERDEAKKILESKDSWMSLSDLSSREERKKYVESLSVSKMVLQNVSDEKFCKKKAMDVSTGMTPDTTDNQSL